MASKSLEHLQDILNHFENNLTRTEEWEIGIDEAGRGPVLGPMVYGCCFWPVKLRKELAKIGFADSKDLKEDERDELFAFVKEINGKYLGFEVKVLDPEYLSNRMLQKEKCSLNKISHDSAIQLIENTLAKGINVVQCYLDTVGKADAYREILKAHFRINYPSVKFTVAEKAESKYPVVAAASICAKVTRDAVLKEWKFREKLGDGATFDFGSGYPGDEKTVTWLKAHRDPVFGFPDLVRFSWKTCENLMNEKTFVEYVDQMELSKQNNGGTLDGFVAREKRGHFLGKVCMTNEFSL